MRDIIRQQLPLVQRYLNYEHAMELQVISKILDEAPEIVALVHADLVRGLNDPETGRKGLTAEQVLRVLIIKQMNGFSYEEIAFHLADSSSYRTFCLIGIADVAPSRSALQRDIKKLRAETLEAINRVLVGMAADKGIEKGRKIRTDCTVVESNIHEPTDSSLLEDSVRVLSKLMVEAKERLCVDLIFTDHSRRARKRALGILNAKKEKKRLKLYKDLLKVTQETIDYAGHVADYLDSYKSSSIEDMVVALGIADQLKKYIPLAMQVINQTERRVVYGEKVPSQEKVVSIFEPHTDIIVKDPRETEYGHKISLTGGVSGMITDMVVERGNPADSTLAKRMIERQKEIYGRMPRQSSMDGGFASMDNLQEIKEMGVKDVVFHKRRGLKISEMAKSTWVYKCLKNFRAGIEGMISFLKRCFGLDRCTWCGFESFKAYAWSSVISANLLIMARHMIT